MKVSALIIMLFICIANKPLYSQTFSPTDSLALLSIDDNCDASDSLNWNTESDPANWEGVTWDNRDPKRVIQLDIDSCQLDNILDLSPLDSLHAINCSFNQLDGLNIEGLSKLKVIYCYTNQLTNLDLSGTTNLTYLHCNDNNLTSLDVSMLSNLGTLFCAQNQLTELDVTSLNNLTRLYCYVNHITNINVAGLSGLIELSCSMNWLTDLDLTGCTGLETLLISYNKFESIDLTGLTSLKTLYANNNKLTTIDVSSLLLLNSYTCYYNKLPFSSIATGLHADEILYDPMDSLYTRETIAGTYAFDYSTEALINDSATTFVFYKNNATVETNISGLYTTNGAGVYFCTMTNGNFPGLVLTTLKITMTDETPALSVLPGIIDFAPGGGADSIFIESNTAWTISGLEPWVTADQSSGFNNDTVILTATANPDTSVRTATVTISAIGVTPQYVTVTQACAPYLMVSDTELIINGEANSTATFDIASNTTWTVDNSDDWLTIDPTIGSNRETITLIAAINNGDAARWADVTISSPGLTSLIVRAIQNGLPEAISQVTVTDAMIYPCPVIDFVNMKLEQEQLPSVINLFTIDGLLLMQLETSNIITEMDMTKYSSGIYILRVVTSGSIIEKKVLKY